MAVETTALVTVPGNCTAGNSTATGARAHSRKVGLRAVVALVVLGGIGYCGWRPIWRQHQISLARQSLRRFEPKAAQERLVSLLTLEPDCAEAEFLLAAACRRDGLLDLAEPHLLRAAELGWDPKEIDRQRALMYFQIGNFRNSGEEIKNLLLEPASDDEAEECYEAVVQGYISGLLLEQARFMTNGWISWRPNSVRAHLFLAELASIKADDEAELAAYREIVRFAPHDFTGRLKLARALMLKHEVDEAYSLFSSCFGDRPRDPEALQGLAEWHHRHGQPEEAKRLIETLLTCEPDAHQRSQALTLLSQILLVEKDYQAAEGALREAVEVDPSSASTVYAFSQILSRCGREEEAQKYLERWRRLRAIDDELEDLHPEILSNPESPDLRCRVGRLLLEQGQTRAGVNWLLSVLFHHPSHVETNRLLAEHYEREGNRELARRHRAVAEGAEVPPSLMQPADALSRPDKAALGEAAE